MINDEAGARESAPRMPAVEVPLRLSEEIDGLLAALTEEPLRLKDLLSVLQGRAYQLLLLLLTLPFCTPIPIPGVSTPFGWMVALIGLRLALGQTPWLPRRVLEASLSPKWVRPLLAATRRVAASMEWLLRPRLVWLLDCRPMLRLYGAMICVCGLLMLLPLPVPFTNVLPAISAAFFAAAMIERDGVAVLCGAAAFVLTLAFFGVLVLGGAEAVLWVKSALAG